MRHLTNVRNRASQAVAALMLALVAPMAFAAGESATITAVFTEYRTEIVIIVVAFAVVLWAKRGGKLLNP